MMQELVVVLIRIVEIANEGEEKTILVSQN